MLGSDLSAVGGTGSGDLFNGGSAWTHGVEFEGAWDPLHGKGLAGNLPIRASYAWTFSRFTEAFDSDFEAWGDVQSGDFMPYVAPHQASMVVAWEAAQWALDVSGRYVSAMRTVAGQGTLVEGDFTPSVAVVDAGLRVQPLLGCEVRLGVQNLFDETYLVARRPYGARPGLPRMVRVGVTFSF
jgi:Fe(3+) dicitrate transport protein